MIFRLAVAPQSLWNHGCCDQPDHGQRHLHPQPPQSLWDHGCCDPNDYLDLFMQFNRLNLFGITGAATCKARGYSPHFVPPQSLWDHGCCDLPSEIVRIATADRLNLFGITGAATLRDFLAVEVNVCRLNLFGITGAATPPPLGTPALSDTASISLGSRVLRRDDRFVCYRFCGSASISLGSRVLRPTMNASAAACVAASISLGSRVLRRRHHRRQRIRPCPPQSLWDHGCCDITVTAFWGASHPRLNLFGITGAATPAPPHGRQPSRPASISLGSRVLRRLSQRSRRAR